MNLSIFQKEPALLVLAPVLVAAIVVLIIFAPLDSVTKATAAGALITIGLAALRSQVTPVAKLEAAPPLTARDRDLTPPPTVRP